MRVVRVRVGPSLPRSLPSSLLALLAATGCAVAPPVAQSGVAPESGGGPAVEIWSPVGTAAMLGTSASATSYFSVDQPAYATAFEVGRDGRLRVLFPATPQASGLVLPGARYPLTAWRAQLANGFAVGGRTVPFTFVLVSEDRPDLSRFGRGKQWRYQVRLEGTTQPDFVIERVAETLYPGEDREYAVDYAFVPPRVDVGGQMLMAQCGLRTNVDHRDYAFYQDLWSVFDLSDPSLGIASFGAMWLGAGWGGWFPVSTRGGLGGLFLQRALLATAAFPGGCWGAGLRVPTLAFDGGGLWGVGRTPVALGTPTVAQPGQPAQPGQLRPSEFRPPLRPPLAQPIDLPLEGERTLGRGRAPGLPGGEQAPTVLGRAQVPAAAAGMGSPGAWTGRGDGSTTLLGLERGRWSGRDPLTRTPATRTAWRMEDMERPERRTRELFAPSPRRESTPFGGMRTASDPSDWTGGVRSARGEPRGGGRESAQAAGRAGGGSPSGGGISRGDMGMGGGSTGRSAAAGGGDGARTGGGASGSAGGSTPSGGDAPRKPQ